MLAAVPIATFSYPNSEGIDTWTEGPFLIDTVILYGGPDPEGWTHAGMCALNSALN
jgi:hypothetical protein